MEQLLIGTRFEEDELKQRQNLYNQQAVNEKGHKRFHGAFTGGFQAGYKGTVGSEEGFVPKTFTSSRSKRANQNQLQSIQDYMDEEDLGGQVIGANLTTKDQFNSFQNESQQLQNKQFGSNLFGKLPSEMIVEERKTVGWEILNNIQFKRKRKEEILNKQKEQQSKNQSDNKNINNNSFFQEEEINLNEFGNLDDDEDDNLFQTQSKQFDTMENYKIKYDFQGIGFNKNTDIEVIDDVVEEEFNRLIKRSYMTQEEIEEEQIKKQEQNRISTNFKKNYNYDEDDDDDFFQNQDQKAIEYDTQEVTQNQGGQKMIKSANIKLVGLAKLFVKDTKPLSIEIKKSEKLNIPEDYNPYKRMQDYIKSGGKMIEFQKQKKKFQKLNAIQRKAILEGQQEMDKIKEQIETKKFVKAKEDVEEEKQEMSNPIYKSWDNLKQQRYHNWLEEKEGKGIFIQVAQLMSYKEMKAEQKEFSKVYEQMNNEQKQESTVMDKIDNLQKKIDEIKNFRQTQPWFPDRLLCKRFGVVPPYKDKEYFDKKMNEFRLLQEKDNFLQTKVFVKGQTQKGSLDNDPSSLGLPTEFRSNKFGLQSSYKKDENDMDYYSDDDNKNKFNKKNKYHNNNEDIYDVSKSHNESKQQRNRQIEEESRLIEQIENEKQEQQIIKEKPPIQLFKSIFGDDDDDDEDNLNNP